jgi:hypothetical protein
MSIGDTDVLARLRAGADSVVEHRFDADAVLAGSRRALRRRRSWQAGGACTTAAAVAFSLALAGPVPVPGVGDVTLPGSEQVRELFGLTDASGCVVPEPAVRRSPVGSDTDLRAEVAFDLADARPMSDCDDVQVDGEIAHDGINPSTLAEDGTFWSPPSLHGAEIEDSDRYFHRVDPFGNGSRDPIAPPVLDVQDDEELIVRSLTPQGRRAAWFETVTDGVGRPASRVVLAAGALRVDSSTGEYGTSRTIAEISRGFGNSLAVTGERVAWREEDVKTIADPGTMLARVASIDSGEPEPLADHVTAIGADEDEIVVAVVDQPLTGSWSTTFTSYRDDGTETTVLTLEHPRDMQVPAVDITDDVLAYASDVGDLVVVPRVDGVVDVSRNEATTVRLDGNSVNELSAAGDAVAWASGPVAYLLRDTAPSRADGPDLLRVGQSEQRERMMIGLAGDRVAWSTTDGSAARIKIATLLEPEQAGSTTAGLAPAEPGSGGRAVPAAPRVTVPDNAKLPAYD